MDLHDHFLIAMPQMEDENFKQSVIYICEHNDQGTMGLVITNPTDLSVMELCSKTNFMMADNRQFTDQLVLAGGPVHLDRGFILHTKTPETYRYSYSINDELMLTTSNDVLHSIGTVDAPEKYLVTLGCTSWAPNQLANEIANNDWLVVPANSHILFDTPVDQRWIMANQLLGIQPSNLIYQAGNC